MLYTSIFWVRKLFQLQSEVAVLGEALKTLRQNPSLGLNHCSLFRTTVNTHRSLLVNVFVSNPGTSDWISHLYFDFVYDYLYSNSMSWLSELDE